MPTQSLIAACDRYSYVDSMFTRILTAVEKRRIQKYLKADGEKDVNIRQLIMRCRRHIPQIKEDLELLERLLAAYEAENGKH
jgi:hypothetical protein